MVYTKLDLRKRIMITCADCPAVMPKVGMRKRCPACASKAMDMRKRGYKYKKKKKMPEVIVVEG